MVVKVVVYFAWHVHYAIVRTIIRNVGFLLLTVDAWNTLSIYRFDRKVFRGSALGDSLFDH